MRLTQPAALVVTLLLERRDSWNNGNNWWGHWDNWDHWEYWKYWGCYYPITWGNWHNSPSGHT